jgi:hypothetical protein
VLVGSTHHEVSLSGGLNHAISAGWDHVLLPRSCFDDTKGILAVQDATGWAPDAGVSGAAAAAAGAGAPTAVAGSRALLKSHYLAFGAAGALLHHLKANLRLVLTPHALQVRQRRGVLLRRVQRAMQYACSAINCGLHARTGCV